jgi:beta-glucanase (GH16 family)
MASKVYLFFFFLLTFQMVQAQIGPLIWEDHFNDGELNLEDWNIESGTGVNGDWGTGQLDRATNRPENISFISGLPGAEDACLAITTQKEYYIDRPYTSGRLNTAGKRSWGPGHRLVARVWPRDVRYKGQGFAFWTMPDELPTGWDYIMWPQGGEVDIMEYVGSIPRHNLGGVHYAWFWENNQWQSWNHGHQAAYYSFETSAVPNPPDPGFADYPAESDDPYAGSSGFHNYGIDWYNDRMEFFVDENVYHIHYFADGGAFQKDGQDELKIREENGKRIAYSEYSHHFEEWYPFEHEMFIILSAGVGGKSYTYGGAIVPDAEFPCSVFIDWVKVYALESSAKADILTYQPLLTFYPQPAKNKIKLQLELDGKYQGILSDASGKSLRNITIRDGQEINLENLPSGTYFLVFNARGKRISKTLIKH